MSIIRLVHVHPGTAAFRVSYGQKTASIEIVGLETTGGPEETVIPGEPYYRERLKELFEAILTAHWNPGLRQDD